MSHSGLPSADDVATARRDLLGIAVETPVVTAGWLEDVVGKPVVLKLENLQRTGSYKVRGAATMMMRLSADERAAGVVAASAGNHAQGVALAAQRRSIPCSIVMPEGASWPKVMATRSFGATVELHGRTFDEALEAARAIAAAQGAAFVPPFDHPDVICGQATVGAELLEQHPEVDTLVVPVGGGGLIAGVAAAALHHQAATGRRVRVVGVQAAGAAAFPASLELGRPVRVEGIDTIADGIAVSQPGVLNLAIVAAHVDRILTVDDASLAHAVMRLLENSKQVVEPAGAAGVAAILDGHLDDAGSLGVIVSGGNIDPMLLQHIIVNELAHSDRYLSVAVEVRDRPGELSRIIQLVAQQGANLVDIGHQRTPRGLPMGSAAVAITVETRGRAQQAGVLRALASAGYDVADSAAT